MEYAERNEDMSDKKPVHNIRSYGKTRVRRDTARFVIGKGVKQELDILSIYLFNMYSEHITRKSNSDDIGWSQDWRKIYQ